MSDFDRREMPRSVFVVGTLFGALLCVAALYFYLRESPSQSSNSKGFQLRSAHYSINDEDNFLVYSGLPIQLTLKGGDRVRWKIWFLSTEEVLNFSIENYSQIPTRLNPGGTSNPEIVEILSSEAKKKDSSATDIVAFHMKPEWQGVAHMKGGFEFEESDPPGRHEVRIKIGESPVETFMFDVTKRKGK